MLIYISLVEQKYLLNHYHLIHVNTTGSFEIATISFHQNGDLLLSATVYCCPQRFTANSLLLSATVYC
jgi:hypothetical protein